MNSLKTGQDFLIDVERVGFRVEYPVPHKGLVIDQVRLFLQEYDWLLKLSPEGLATRLQFYPLMQLALKKNWSYSYLSKAAIAVLKEMWVKQVLAEDPQWKQRIAHAILWHDTNYWNFFKERNGH